MSVDFETGFGNAITSEYDTNFPSVLSNDTSHFSYVPDHRPVIFKYALFKAWNAQMPKVEINIPEHLEMQIAQMVEQGEFLNREEAIEDLLSTGMKAYKTSGPMDDDEPGFEDDGMMGHDDEYVF